MSNAMAQVWHQIPYYINVVNNTDQRLGILGGYIPLVQHVNPGKVKSISIGFKPGGQKAPLIVSVWKNHQPVIQGEGQITLNKNQVDNKLSDTSVPSAFVKISLENKKISIRQE